jgi:hypothetical protein
MTASFPSSVRQLQAKIDIQDTVLADHINVIQDEVRAIETSLGAAVNDTSVLVSNYSGTFVQDINWNSLGARLKNIEAGLVNGTGSSANYVAKTGDNISPIAGRTGLTITARTGNLFNLFETRDSSTALGFNVDYTGKPKVGTLNVLYTTSPDYVTLTNSITAAAAQAATATAIANAASISPFLFAGM